MLQVFYLDVAKVDLYVAYTCMLQVYVSSVSGVSYVCCKCFIWILHMFCNGYHAIHVFSWCFRRILQVFQLFWTYVASISSRCCKNRYDVAHVVVGPTCRSRLLQLLGLCGCAWEQRGRERQARETEQAQIVMRPPRGHTQGLGFQAPT